MCVFVENARKCIESQTKWNQNSKVIYINGKQVSKQASENPYKVNLQIICNLNDTSYGFSNVGC